MADRRDRLVELLRSERWIAGARTQPLDYLVTLVYVDLIRAEDLQDRSLEGLAALARAYGGEAALVVMLFEYMRQVQNGGHGQWFLNGYATDQWDGLQVSNVALKKAMLAQFAQSPAFQRPALIDAMQLCRRAHPTMESDEFAELDTAFHALSDDFAQQLESAAQATWALEVPPIADLEQRFVQGRAFVHDLLDLDNIPALRMNMETVKLFNEVSRAFDALMKVPTLEKVAARTKRDGADIARVYWVVRGRRGRALEEEAETQKTQGLPKP